jgi:hypothetical protein
LLILQLVKKLVETHEDKEGSNHHKKNQFQASRKKHAKEYKKTKMNFMKKTTIAWEWIGKSRRKLFINFKRMGKVE